MLAAVTILPTVLQAGLTDYARDHCIFSLSGTVQRKEPWMRSPEQIVKSIAEAKPKTIVLHFHGGLVDSESGLLDAHKMGRGVYKDVSYPVHFIWESGPAYAAAPAKADWSGWGPRIFKSSPALGVSEGEFAVPIVGGDPGRLKTLMLPIRSGWRQIKRFAELTCDPRIRDAAVPKFLDALLPYWEKNPSTRVVLVGHSAGAFLIGHMLELIQARYPKFGKRTFDLALVAPACTYEFVSLRSYQFTRYIKDIRVFGLSDPVERRDLISDYISLKGVDRFFPSSILYLISNHLEERNDTMILGLERFRLLGEGVIKDRMLTSREADLYAKVKRVLRLDTSLTWSPSADSGATRHTKFFEDARTISSLREFLGERDLGRALPD